MRAPAASARIYRPSASQPSALQHRNKPDRAEYRRDTSAAQTSACPEGSRCPPSTVLLQQRQEKTMPTPVDLLLDPLTWILMAMFAGLGVAEVLAPGRELPRVRGWKARALTAFLVYFLLSSYLPLLWAKRWRPCSGSIFRAGRLGQRSASDCSSTRPALTRGTVRCIASRRCGACCTRCITARSGSTSSARTGSARSTWSPGRCCRVSS